MYPINLFIAIPIPTVVLPSSYFHPPNTACDSELVLIFTLVIVFSHSNIRVAFVTKEFII